MVTVAISLLAASLLPALAFRMRIPISLTPPCRYASHRVHHQAFVEFCEAAASSLMEVTRRCPAAVGTAGGGRAAALAGGSSGGSSGSGSGSSGDVTVTIGRPGAHQLCVPLSSLREKADTYLSATRFWATRAMEVNARTRARRTRTRSPHTLLSGRARLVYQSCLLGRTC